jgi:hypothetical protein
VARGQITRLLLATVLLLQDRTVEQPIDKLRSDKVEEREEAARKLKEMGKAALPELQKARGDKDPEVASRARYLAQVAALREKLSPDWGEIRAISDPDHTQEVGGSSPLAPTI